MKARLHTLGPWIGLVLCLIAIGVPQAQPPQEEAPRTPPVNASSDPLLRSFEYRSIGPANMGGRIDDIEAVESNPHTFYVGFATGGVWKTVNNGTTFEPIFDTYTTHSIGDLAVCQSDPNIIWVGTGEPNNRQSSSFGDGIYKSVDGGKTFQHMGLTETQTIARVRIDPQDPDVVYVAAVGHLFGPNPERGIFKTTDGGKTWSKVKYIDENTGFTDLVMDPSDNKTLYAAAYQRRRTSFGFVGGGPGSGLWKTTDAGKTWTQLTGNGLPEGIVLGRIGLDVSRSKPNVVYAQLELTPPPREPGQAGRGGGRGFGQDEPGPPDPKRSGVWRSEDKGKTWTIMSNNNNRPMYYSQIRVDPKNDQIIYTMGSSFYKSTDGGKTFETVRGIAHGDHHALWINPGNSRHLILGNDGGLDVSYDQADTWEFINTMAVSQFYAVGVDMRKPYYVYGGLQDNGSWGAPTRTRSSNGITNMDWFRIGGGDGFYVQVDPTDHNTIYVESQDGNVRRLDLSTGESVSIRPRPPRPERPGQTPGGFGGFGQPATSNVVPAPSEDERYRFNWNSPIHISPHNPRTIYFGGNRLFKSMDRGDTWTASPDLTKQIDRDTLSIMGFAGDKPVPSRNDGVSSYGNIITIAESPVHPGILWVGTDDGNVQLSRDGGVSWTNVAGNIAGVPERLQVSRVAPSHFDAATCYVSIDGHRNDDLKPYVFVTRDYGRSWSSIANNLPTGNVNVIKEDPKNRNLLYVGTEFGLYISLNGGSEWKRFMTGLPTVRVDDLLIHPRENDLVVGTHGRGVFVLDDITPLQQMTEDVMSGQAHMFTIRAGTLWKQDPVYSRTMGGAKHFRGENPPDGTAISYYLAADAAADVRITISDITGKVIRELTGPRTAGIHRIQWDLRHEAPEPPEGQQGRGGFGRGGRREGPLADAGVYMVKVVIDGKEFTNTVRVDDDVIIR